MTALCTRMLADLRLRNYSPKTREIYIYHVVAFARYFKTSPDNLGVAEIRQYLLHLIEEKRCPRSCWRQTVSALRFLYRTTLGLGHIVPCIPYPRKEFRLPTVLSTAEVQQLFRAMSDLKHRTILMTIYAAGLRLSEAISLTRDDIDTGRMVMHVRQGKGSKDRLVPLSSVLLHGLREYWRREGLGWWLFPGKSPYRSLDEVCPGGVAIAFSSTNLFSGTRWRARVAMAEHLFPNALVCRRLAPTDAGSTVLALPRAQAYG